MRGFTQLSPPQKEVVPDLDRMEFKKNEIKNKQKI